MTADRLGHWQLSHYQSVELPRLQRLIDKAGDKAGSKTDLINSAEDRFNAMGAKLLIPNDLSGFTRDKTSGPIRNSAISERTYYRLALLLDIDEDIVWGALCLRLYLCGKIQDLERPTIEAIKSACNLNPEADIDFRVSKYLNQASPQELKDIGILAIKKLAKSHSIEPAQESDSFYTFIVGILGVHNKTTDELLTYTALTPATLEKIKAEEPIKQYEIESLAEWLSAISGTVLTAETLEETYSLKAIN